MSNLEQLVAQAQKINQQIAQLRQAQRAQAIAEIHELMVLHVLTLADLSGMSKLSGLSGKPVAAKYTDGKGNSWSGRGLKPRWLTAAVNEGKRLEDFAV